MSPSIDTEAIEPADLLLLRRVQEENQRQIVGKLLHDLRNPVHSLRITLELFGRLGRREGDLNKLVERASAYVGPAEAALNGLLTINQRLGVYLSNPTAPAPAPLAVDEWLEEIAGLLRNSPRRLQVTRESGEGSAVGRLIADRPRVSHALLRHCLGGAASHVSLVARADGSDSIHIDVSFDASADADARNDSGADVRAEVLNRLSMEELRLLIANAGGTVAGGTAAGIRLSFPRSPD